jgi:hypothetical protein
VSAAGDGGGDHDARAVEIRKGLRPDGERLRALAEEAKAAGRRLLADRPALARTVQILGALGDVLEPTKAPAPAAAPTAAAALPSGDVEGSSAAAGGGGATKEG